MAISISGLFGQLAPVASMMRTLMGMLGTTGPSPNSSAWGLTPGGMSGATVRNLNDMLNRIQTIVGTSNPDLMSGTTYGVSAPLFQLQTSLPQQIGQALSYLQSLAQGTIIKVVNADVPLSTLDIRTATIELVRQMISQSETVHANALSSTVTADAANTGNPTWVITFVDANGKNLQYAYKETMIAKTTRDYADGATAGNETIHLEAPAGQVSPALNYLWPSGNGYCSGFSGDLTVVDPTQSNGSGGNLLANSAFKGTWTSNQPQYWTAGTGAAGTNWQDGTSNNYLSGAHCFEFLGDGSTLASIYQNFANASLTGGNTSTLLPDTVYHVRLMYKLSAASPAAGTLAVTLKDGSGNVVNDNSGTANRVSVNLAGVGNTNYNALSGSFRVPTNIPTSGLRIYLELTVALTNGKNVFIDALALTQPTQQTYGGLYPGGPYVSVHRGSTDTIDWTPNPANGDRWTVAIANDYGGVWQTWLWQVLNLPSIGTPIPNAQTGNTQSDSLAN